MNEMPGSETQARQLVGLFRGMWYRRQLTHAGFAADRVETSALLAHYLSVGEAAGLSPHPLFEPRWYLRQIGAALGETGALGHYRAVGARAGLSPHPLFDPVWYLGQLPPAEADRARSDPLLHFLARGARFGADPHPLFDAKRVEACRPAGQLSEGNPLLDHILRGPAAREAPHALFDTEWYLEQHGDEVEAAGVSALQHYLEVGVERGYDPHPLFDAVFYRARHMVAGDPGDPLSDYVARSPGEVLDPHPLFDARWYVETYRPTLPPGRTGLQHYLEEGAAAGWNPHPLFHAAFYLIRNEAVAGRGENPLRHYVVSGHAGACDPHPLFDNAWYREAYAEDMAASGTGPVPLVHYVLTGAPRPNPHPLFWCDWYAALYAEHVPPGVDPLDHYLSAGDAGFQPNPLFDGRYYLASNKDVEAAGYNPLFHFVNAGEVERRDPHPLFDTRWYHARYADRLPDTANSLAHFLTEGLAAGLDPSPLFDGAWYLRHYPDAAKEGGPALAHYVNVGRRLGHAPNPLFDPAFYVAACGDPAVGVETAFDHFLLGGWRLGLDPHPAFETRFYLACNPDVAAAEINPLAHYLVRGFREHRRANRNFEPAYYRARYLAGAPLSVDPLAHFVEIGERRGYEPSDGFFTRLVSAPARLDEDADALRALALGRGVTGPPPPFDPRGDGEYVPPVDLLPWFNPLNIVALPTNRMPPRLNILLPGAAMRAMSGGPNTIVNLMFRIAAAGVPLRIISTDVPPDADTSEFIRHSRRLADLDPEVEIDVVVADGSNRAHHLYVGEGDVFLATAWWTAQMAKYAVRQTRHRQFLYMIQDYEPLLHASSSSWALAEETYALDMIPIVNTRLLLDFLVERKIGKFADPAFAAGAVVFEPALDRSKFHFEPPVEGARRKLLFYARPTSGLRNLFEIGVAALQKLAADGVLDASWDVVGMGEPFEAVALGNGVSLVPAPWLGFDGYAEQMRHGSVLLSLMLSPHPSYPPLEMAACGRPAVTTAFANKTAAALAAISPNIVAVEPTIEALAAALTAAIERLDVDAGAEASALAYPETWAESFDEAVPRLVEVLGDMVGLPRLPSHGVVAEDDGRPRRFPGYERWPANAYEAWRIERLAERRQGAPVGDPSILSLLTTVWNTPPRFLEPLIECVLGQDCPPTFEWVLLDNGSADAETRAVLARIAGHPTVRLLRVKKNLGIVGGMRHVLKRATRRYVVPLDSDDLLTPDALGLLAGFLEAKGFPALAHTDEDKVLGPDFRDPYCKPDWDPVLFAHSCYIAHVCAIDREKLIALGGYSDDGSQGCHDWDTFFRFLLAGETPVHVPEILYTWRMHEGSTAGNIASKEYIYNSHRNVLGKFLAARGGEGAFELTLSPLFDGAPDWRFVEREADRPEIRTIPLRAARKGRVVVVRKNVAASHSVGHPVGEADWAAIRAIAEEAARAGALVHLLHEDVAIEDESWAAEAASLMRLFPDTAVVGGRLCADGLVVDADTWFEVGDGCRSPNAGRSLNDPGYFAQMWKPHSCDAVPALHCVVRPELLADVAGRLVGTCATVRSLGLWLGHAAAAQGQRVVYSPFLAARLDGRARLAPSLAERRAQAALCESLRGADGTGDRRPPWRSWPPNLGGGYRSAFDITPRRDRLRHRLDRRQAGERGEGDPAAGLLARAMAPQAAVAPRTVSILTSVWLNTPLDLFEKTVESLLGQTVPFDEWVILRNGPVHRDLDAFLRRLARDPRIKLDRVAKNAGIIGAMRRCLAAASGDLVVPMDADDLLTEDALARMRQAFAREDCDFAFSDENILAGEDFRDQPRRRRFDEILNRNDSYVWHLCMFDRKKALELGVYSDDRANFCHDWDSVTRFADAGLKIGHAPHVLYHWRVHERSTSNSGSLNEGSLASSRFVLERSIAAMERPERYEVARFPIFRGAEQLAILRRRVDPTPLCVAVMPAGGQGGDVPPTIAAMAAAAHAAVLRCEVETTPTEILDRCDGELVCFVSAACVLKDDGGAFEAMRLFEMHPRVVLAGGRLFRSDGVVVEAGSPVADREAVLNPYIGMRRTDPGPGALALKPQTVHSVPAHYFFVRRSFLADTLAQGHGAGSFETLAAELSRAAERLDGGIAYSPLIEGRLAPRRSG